MAGTQSVLNSLAARRQMLVGQSERNRKELDRELADLKQEAMRLIKPVRKAGHYLSTGIKIAGVLLTLRRVWLQWRIKSAHRKNWITKLWHGAWSGIFFRLFRAVAR